MGIPRIPSVDSDTWLFPKPVRDGGSFVTLKNAAKDPDLLIVGTITRNASGVITSASVIWPDGTPGTFTTDTIDPSGAINSYRITYGQSATYTQPTITRDSSGAAINVPQIVVS